MLSPYLLRQPPPPPRQPHRHPQLRADCRDVCALRRVHLRAFPGDGRKLQQPSPSLAPLSLGLRPAALSLPHPLARWRRHQVPS